MDNSNHSVSSVILTTEPGKVDDTTDKFEVAKTTSSFHLPNGRWGHSMTSLPDGKILILGGLSNIICSNGIIVSKAVSVGIWIGDEEG